MKIHKFKEVLSHIFPLQIEVCSGKFHSLLEVSLSNGKYLLNSARSNYSFGSLHTIFKNTFKDIDISKHTFSNALILGLGGGSIMHLLQKKYSLYFPVTGLEIDPVIIEFGNKYFGLSEYKDLTIINDDAFNFVKNCNSSYDLIIVDLYLNDEVPEIFHKREFISYLKKNSNSNTIILFNKMLNSRKALGEFNDLVYEMTFAFGSISILSYEMHGVENKMLCVNANKKVA